MKTFVVCVGSMLFAVASAVVAHADPADDTFLSYIARSGYGLAEVGDPAQLIAVAHTACDDANRQPYSQGRDQAFADAMNTLHLSRVQAGGILQAAAIAYCPQFIGMGNTNIPDPH